MEMAGKHSDHYFRRWQAKIVTTINVQTREWGPPSALAEIVNDFPMNIFSMYVHKGHHCWQSSDQCWQSRDHCWQSCDHCWLSCDHCWQSCAHCLCWQSEVCCTSIWFLILFAAILLFLHKTCMSLIIMLVNKVAIAYSFHTWKTEFGWIMAYPMVYLYVVSYLYADI